LNTLAAATSANEPAIATQEVTSRERWNRLSGGAAAPHFPQAWVYGEGKRAQGWAIERLAFECGDESIAICQVLVRRLLGMPVVARINRGPIFLSQSPSSEMQWAVFRALRQRWRFGRRGLLLIAPALPSSETSTALLRESGFFQRRAGGWGSSLIELSPSLESIRAALSSKWRNHLNASLKAGLEVRVRQDSPGWEWMLERHATNMKSKGFVGPEVGFVRHMIAAGPEDFRVFQALIGAEPVCGILVARFGDHAETFLSWTSDAGRRSNAHHRLLWEVISEMKSAGCRALDLGGYTTSEKYGAYKRGMKGKEYRLAGEWLVL
jgi:lipid II:glycine glycyltransferase (peptidoglycan interpeptide bridge formation enzyme)